jgi:hypothetical protein
VIPHVTGGLCVAKSASPQKSRRTRSGPWPSGSGTAPSRCRLFSTDGRRYVASELVPKGGPATFRRCDDSFE